MPGRLDKESRTLQKYLTEDVEEIVDEFDELANPSLPAVVSFDDVGLDENRKRSESIAHTRRARVRKPPQRSGDWVTCLREVSPNRYCSRWVYFE